MANRNFAILKHLVRVLVLGGLIVSAGAYAQDSANPAAAPPAATAATPDDIRRGQDLFDGRVLLAGGGPSCNACHHVQHEAIVGGGNLSTDLTQSFSRMGKEGLGAILGNAPFPVMQAAYTGKALAADEIRALTAFLEHADQRQQTSIRPPIAVGLKMIGAGAAGVVALLAFFSLVGRPRKRQSVNQAIYDRQIKSE